MSVQNKTTLKTYFETGDKPTQNQFADLIDSMALVTDTASLPETEHFAFAAAHIEEEDEEMEIIGIKHKPNSSDLKILGMSVIKHITEGKEFAVLGGLVNGLKIERSNIQENGDADIKYYATGLTQAATAGENNTAFLMHNTTTGEIKRLSMEALASLIDFFSTLKQSLKQVGFAAINSAAATSQIVIDLDDYELPAGRYVKSLHISTGAFNNVSAIQQAYITLPGSAVTIDVLPYLSANKNVVIPITQVQELQATATQLTLTLNFDAGNGEVNPQNFTQGAINVQAMISQNYNN